MHDLSVRRRMLVLSGLSALTFLAACEDKRVKELNTGITRDSAVTVLAQEIKGGGADSFPNVYTRDRYLIGGKNYEVLYFTPNNEKIEKAGKDTIPKRKLAPIVFVNNRLIGRGWPFWDSLAATMKIPVPPKQ